MTRPELRDLRPVLLLALLGFSVGLVGCPGGGNNFTAPPIDPADLQVQANTAEVNVGNLDMGGTAIPGMATGGAKQNPGGLPADEETLLEGWTNEYGNFKGAKQGGEKPDPVPDFIP